jgi:7-carboxy-7-deazaguanine synthase
MGFAAMYTVKEIFYTLQGEGARTGRPSVFCRFAGCNLWSGREADRAAAICRFCDTDFVGTNGTGGGRFQTAEALAERIDGFWPVGADGRRYAVCTGGEPLLQLDEPLIQALHARDFEIAIETNGTLPAPPGIDWICVSPKAGAGLVQRSGNEMKLVYPQDGIDPADLVALEFDNFFLQPMDSPERDANTVAACAYCLEHPTWRLSLQTHKFLEIR